MGSRPYILRKGVSELADLKDGRNALSPQYMGGHTWYVDSVNGNTGNDGESWDHALAGLDAAIGKCTANQGDVIYVLPGHAESIIAAGTITADVAGVNIVGIGKGEDRPTFTFTTADTATFLVSAVDVYIENLIFAAGKDGLDVLLDVEADGCRVVNCEFRSNETSAYQCDNYVDITGTGVNVADRCEIHGCRFFSLTAGATAAINIGRVHDGLVIADNWIDGDFSGAGIESASAFTNALIARNVVANRNSGEHAIELSAAATGLLVDNRLYGDTLGTILDPGSMMCLGNLETDAIDQAGVDTPRTSAGGLPADAINATTIATGAIDADAIAADTILGADNADNAFASTSVVANADGSLIERLEYVQNHTTAVAPATFVPGLGYRVSKTEDVNTATTDDLFTVTGKVLIKLWTIEVTNIIGAQPIDYILRVKTDNTAITASTDISAAAIGVIMNVTGDASDTLETAGEGIKTCDFSDSGMTNRVVGLAGGSLVLQSVRTAGDAGDAMIHTIFYLPLEASAAIATAA